MLALQAVTAHSKGLALIRDFADDVPEWLTGDRRKLNQILLNTIGNALKFTDEGEVTVRVERASAQPAHGVRLVFHVSDTGIGIPRSEQGEVFKPFHQVPDVAHRRPGGTGLGLAICQRLVELLQGRIWLDSEEGKGTTVSFELPFALAAQDDRPAEDQDTAPERPSRSLDVLVVEDDEINRVVCQRYLESLGHRAQTAASGEEALAWLEHAEPPDCVLMDMSLPGKSGLDVTQVLRMSGNERWRDLPVIGMSAHATAVSLDHPAAATLAGFLSKPFQRRELERALARATHSAPGTSARVTPDERREGSCLDENYLNGELQNLGRDTLEELARLFEAEARTALTALQAAAAAGDGMRVSQLAHKLRGAAGNLGLVQVVQTCAKLEQRHQPEAGVSEERHTLLAGLPADIERATAALRHWLDRTQD